MRPSIQALFRAACWVGLGASFATSCGSEAPEDLTEVKAVVRDRFPDAPQLSTADLAAWLADETLPQPILLDARSAPEYEISHLRGAHLAGDLQAAQRVLEGADKDVAIIAYCSVGYRSSQLVERLRADGFLEHQQSGGFDLPVGQRGQGDLQRPRPRRACPSVRREVGPSPEALPTRAAALALGAAFRILRKNDDGVSDCGFENTGLPGVRYRRRETRNRRSVPATETDTRVNWLQGQGLRLERHGSGAAAPRWASVLL